MSDLNEQRPPVEPSFGPMEVKRPIVVIDGEVAAYKDLNTYIDIEPGAVNGDWRIVPGSHQADIELLDGTHVHTKGAPVRLQPIGSMTRPVLFFRTKQGRLQAQEGSE